MPISRKKSCVKCRQSKLRCNQAIPSCSRCFERGVRCVYDWKSSEAVSSAISAASRVARTRSTPPGMHEDLIGEIQSENLNNTSALSASTFMNNRFQDTDISLGDFHLNLTSMDAHGERFFDAPSVETLLGTTNESSIFPLRTGLHEHPSIEIPEGSAENLEIMSGHFNDFERRHLGRTLSPNHACHPLHTMPVQLPSRRTFQRRNVIRYCLSSSITLGQLTGFPKMMIQGDRLPPFICPPCQLHEEMAFDCARSRMHQCLPKDLAICASLVQMFYSRTPQNADFVWKTIYAEKDRLHREVRGTQIQAVLTHSTDICIA